MDIQHEIAKKIATFLERDRIKKNEDIAERLIILTYGIEVFLNEFIKFLIAVIVGIILGEIKIVLCAIIYLVLIRRYSGGFHFNSNLVCILYTLVDLLVMPIIGRRIEITIWVPIVLVVIEVLAFLIFVKKRQNEDNKSLIIRKVKLLTVYFAGGAVAYLIGGIPFVRGMIYLAILVVLALKESE